MAADIMMLPVLTAYEKEHLGERQPLPERYIGLSDEEMDRRIAGAKSKLGRRLVILGHHYQRDEVIKFADYTGDSYKLAGQVSKHPDAEFIVFCGVHFMAESADVLSGPTQQVILPDLAAGCSMADMADPDQLELCWSDLTQMLKGSGSAALDAGDVVPVTYINSSAAIKAFVGEHGGVVCTSSNAAATLKWAWARGERILFMPDQHLGRRHRDPSREPARARSGARSHGGVARSVRLPVLDDVPRLAESSAVGARGPRRRRGAQPHRRARCAEALDEGRARPDAVDLVADAVEA